MKKRKQNKEILTFVCRTCFSENSEFEASAPDLQGICGKGKYKYEALDNLRKLILDKLENNFYSSGKIIRPKTELSDLNWKIEKGVFYELMDIGVSEFLGDLREKKTYIAKAERIGMRYNLNIEELGLNMNSPNLSGARRLIKNLLEKELSNILYLSHGRFQFGSNTRNIDYKRIFRYQQEFTKAIRYEKINKFNQKGPFYFPVTIKVSEILKSMGAIGL